MIYYQCPPTGEYPSVMLPKDELEKCWVHLWDKGWVPATSNQWSWHLHGKLLIPEVVIESEESKQIVVEHVIRVLRELRVDGCYGVWAREFWALPSLVGTLRIKTNDYKYRTEVLWLLKAGFVWHPDPEALSRCQADTELHERRGSDYEGSLAWHRLDAPFELWNKIQKVGTPWVAGLQGWPPRPAVAQ